MNALYCIVTIKELFAEYLHLMKIRINKTKVKAYFLCKFYFFESAASEK